MFTFICKRRILLFRPSSLPDLNQSGSFPALRIFDLIENIGIITFLVLLPIFLCSRASAQTINTAPAISWQKSLGGSGKDVANSIGTTSDGGYIIAGSSNSNDGDITGNHGQTDFCLIKLNDAGNVEWQYSYGGTSFDDAVSVVPAFDGGFAVAGKSNSNNGDITDNYGSSDYCLIKTNDQGILQWQKSYGGSLNEVAHFMAPTSDNGFVIAGTSESNDGDVTGNHGAIDIWIIKVDQNGALQWQKTFGGSRSEIANDIKQTNEGGYIITGYSLSGDGDLPTNRGEEDFLFFKLDANGNLQWLKTMGGTGGDCGSAAVQTIDGGYAMCGLTHSRDSDVVGYHTGHDVWIIKTNSTGVAVWTRCLGGSNADNGLDINQQPDGTIIVSGYTGSNDYDVSDLHGLHDIWLTALDTSGNLLWQKTLGGTNYDYPRNLQIISTGYIVAGKTNSNDGDVSGNHGDYDFWIVKLNTACTNVYYADADGDGYGNPNSMFSLCSQPLRYVTNSSDCNDAPGQSGATIHPGAADSCNNIDDDCNGIIDENAINATISPGENLIVCKGTKVTLSANNRAGISYQWMKNNVDISGATKQTYKTSAAAEYKVSESNSLGCESVSAVIAISTVANPAATITPLSGLDICNTTSAGVLQANGNTGLTYQWQKGTNNIAGATNRNYTATIADIYKVTTTNGNGCSKKSSGIEVINSCREISMLNDRVAVYLSLYPNPSAGKFIVELETADDSSTAVTIEVFSEIGQRVYREIVAFNEGILHEEIQLQSGTPAGIYLVRVVLNEKVYMVQLTYQK